MQNHRPNFPTTGPTEATFLMTLIRAARPWQLLAGVLLYALGGGIAYYLGHYINWPVYWLGQGIVTLLQVSSSFLREYFDRAGQPPFQPPRDTARRNGMAGDDLTGSASGNGSRRPVAPTRVIYFQVAATTLTTGAVLTVLLMASGRLTPAALLILALSFALAIGYAVPPFRLVYSGYGELVQAILLANLFPALAFLLQAGELHRLLAMLTFPLTFLYLATALARSLQSYLDDIQHNRQTMMIRLGWQRGMNFHNLLIALAYLLLALAVIAGLPWQLAFPAFLSLPVGVFQILQMNGIANGARPRWRLLSLTAIATVGLAIYFMNLALWTS